MKNMESLVTVAIGSFVMLVVFLAGVLLGMRVKGDIVKKNEAIIHAKKGDMVYIPQDCEITGIGLYRNSDDSTLTKIRTYKFMGMY